MIILKFESYLLNAKANPMDKTSSRTEIIELPSLLGWNSEEYRPNN